MSRTTATMAERMTFDEFRAFMWETPKGQVVDSLIATEIGVLDYMAYWDAHNDFYESIGETLEEHDVVLDFLIAIAETLDLASASDDIDKVLGAHAHD